MRLLSALMMVLFVGVAPAIAQGVPTRAPVDPYKKLFQQPSLEKVAREQKLRESTRQPQPRSGMLCVEGKQDRMQYCIRTIEPPTPAR